MKNIKFYIFQLYIFLMPYYMQSTALENSFIDKTIVNSEQLTDFNNPTFISEPFTITKAGSYVLNNPADFNPTMSGQSYITIESNNVILDLNKKTINLATGNTQPFTTGIMLQPNLRNVVIRNGTIVNLTWYGIYINDGCDMISIDNIGINNCVNAGIFFEGLQTGTGISNIIISNVAIQNISNFDGNAYGILLKYVSVCDLEQCIIDNLTTSVNCYGIKIKNSNSARCRSCIVNNNMAGGTVMKGYHILNCSPCVLSDSLSSNNTCTSADPASVTFGFDIENSENQFFENCTAVSNNCTYTACGFKFYQCSNCQVFACQSFSNTSSLLDGIGFYDDNGNGNKFTQCESSNNIGAINGYGFILNSISKSIIESCNIRNNMCLTGTAFGISLTTTSCIITQNTLTGHTGVSAGFGIFDSAEDTTGNVYLGNTAMENDTNYNLSASTIPIFTGPLTATPSPFENISLYQLS